MSDIEKADYDLHVAEELSEHTPAAEGPEPLPNLASVVDSNMVSLPCGSPTSVDNAVELDTAVLEWRAPELKRWMESEGLTAHHKYFTFETGLELLALTRDEVDITCSQQDASGFTSLTYTVDPDLFWAALQRLRILRSVEFKEKSHNGSMNDSTLNILNPASPRRERENGCGICFKVLKHVFLAIGVMLLIASVQSNPVPWNRLGSIYLEDEDKESDFRGDLFSAENNQPLYVAVASHPYISTLVFMPALMLPAEAEDTKLNGSSADETATLFSIALQIQKNDTWRATGSRFTMRAFEGKPISDSHRFKAEEEGGAPLRLQVNITTELPSVPFKMRVRAHPKLVKYAPMLGLLVLILMYVMIISECVPKVIAAMVASYAVIGLHNYVNESCSLREVVTWIDYETICLLFGMMVMVGILSETGVFEWLAVRAYRISDGDSWRLLLVLSALTGIMTAFLDNVTTILLVAPVTMKLCDVLDLPPTPLLLAQVIFSNICGAVTPIGDPPNVIIANNKEVIKSGVTFLTFTGNMLPGTVLACVAAVFYLKRVLRPTLVESIPADEKIKKEMSVTNRAVDLMDPHMMTTKAAALQRVAVLEAQLTLCHSPEADAMGVVTQARPGPDELLNRFRITNKGLFLQSGSILTIAVVLFFLHSTLHLKVSIAMLSLIGAVSVIAVQDQISMHKVLQKIEWETLLFFAALFVVMRGLEELGLINEIAEMTGTVVKHASHGARPTVAVMWVLLVSAFASAFIDNIPFTAAMVPVIVQLAADPEIGVPLKPLIFALSFGTCFGGNGTVIGASANVVAVGLAAQQGHKISFWSFFKLGMPATIITVLVAGLYMAILVQFY